MQNKGYISYKRSVRSRDAIKDYIVPLSHINKSLINRFINHEDFSLEEKNILNEATVEKWKYIAKNIGTTEWHHTSSFYNETKHYDLIEIAQAILEKTLDKEFEKHKTKENRNKNFEYGVIKVNIWGGTKSHPKVVGHDDRFGIVIGNWLFYKKNTKDLDSKISKYKIDSNNVVELKKYESYATLVKKHKQYKNTKKIFNRLIKEKIKG